MTLRDGTAIGYRQLREEPGVVVLHGAGAPASITHQWASMRTCEYTPPLAAVGRPQEVIFALVDGI